MVRLKQAIDEDGAPIVGCIPQSDYVNAYVFSGAGTAEDTPPEWANYVLARAIGDIDVFVNIGGQAAVPTVNITDGTASEPDPELRQLGGAISVGIAVGAAGTVMLAYYG